MLSSSPWNLPQYEVCGQTHDKLQIFLKGGGGSGWSFFRFLQVKNDSVRLGRDYSVEISAQHKVLTEARDVEDV